MHMRDARMPQRICSGAEGSRGGCDIIDQQNARAFELVRQQWVGSEGIAQVG